MSSGVGASIAWYVALLIIGAAGVPIAWALLPTLPERGLSLARPIALLLAAWFWWMGSVLGVLPNSPAGASVAVIGLIALAGWIISRDGMGLLGFLKARRRLLFGYEALFLFAFASWALYRAFIPNIETAGGEKYMEMTFISGILASPRFPPTDPWMSGHTISYYYFGYVISAMLIQLSGVDRFVAFNLIVPMTLGLTLVATFGLGWNLVALDSAATRRARILGGALGAGMLALVGNLSGALEVVYRAGWMPRSAAVWLDVRNLTAGANTCGHDDVAFGSLADAAASGVPIGLLDYLPDRFMWWWRGSRIIHDDCAEIIHEFPFFSFMLADVHPHVLAIPYVLVVVGFGLALLLGATRQYHGPRLWGPQWLALAFFVGALAFLNTWDLPTYAFLVVVAYGAHSVAHPPADLGSRTANGAFALVIGVATTLWWIGRDASTSTDSSVGGLLQALPPTGRAAVAVFAVALVVAGAYSILRRALVHREPSMIAIVDSTRFTAWLAALAYLLFLPFYAEFGSQAQGFGIADHSSRPAQWLIHLGVPVFLASSLVVSQIVRTAAARTICLWLASIAVALSLSFIPAFAPSITIAAAAVLVTAFGIPWWLRGRIAPLTSAWLSIAGPVVVALVFIRTRGAWDMTGDAFGTWTPHTPAALGLLLIASVAIAVETWMQVAHVDRSAETLEQSQESREIYAPTEVLAPTKFSTPTDVHDPAEILPPTEARTPVAIPAQDFVAPSGTLAASSFALICVATGSLLVIGTEFVYVRDLFDNRMNSIFKLSFQSWILFSVGGAYALYTVGLGGRRWARVVWGSTLAILLAASAIYSVGAVLNRTDTLRWHILSAEGPAAWRKTLTLDGLDWWRAMHPGDLAAANWLRANAGRHPTLLEASGDSYSHVGRMALATGFPTVLGPHGHEGQWRGTREEIDPRLADVTAFYSTMSATEMESMLERYDVDFVIVGQLEESLYSPPPITLRQIEEVLELVYSHDTTRIYARRTSGPVGSDG